MRRLRRKVSLILAIATALSIMFAVFVELRLRPIVTDFAATRSRQYSSEIINRAVASVIDESSALVVVTQNESGVQSASLNSREIAKIQVKAVDAVNEALSSKTTLKLSFPLFNLTGSTLASGIGIPVKVKLLPTGDISADIKSEFVASGINQTLHKVVLRLRLCVILLVGNRRMVQNIERDIILAETVIVGKVPDAYTAINRFELDEQEENDLNDYAAKIP